MRSQMQVGQFIIDRQLGRGGMAEVWLGHNAVLGTPVAVKCLISPWAGHPELEERFLREARRQGALDHPNLIKVYGFEYVEGHSFLIMQYIDGGSLDDRLSSGGRKPLEFPDILRISTGALQGLGYAHDRQIVHRDIKPSNIMLDRTLHAYIGDFGLVMVRDDKRMTRTGTLMGTPMYMSPEQILHPKQVDHRSDIYSFGCVFYEMFTGRTPFHNHEGDSDFHVKMAHTTEQPQSPRDFNPAVTPEMEAVVLKCLEKEPDRRFQTCSELSQALTSAMSGVLVLPGTQVSIPVPVIAAAAEPIPAPKEEAVVFPWDEPAAQPALPQPAAPIPQMPIAQRSPTQAEEVFPWDIPQRASAPPVYAPPMPYARPAPYMQQAPYPSPTPYPPQQNLYASPGSPLPLPPPPPRQGVSANMWRSPGVVVGIAVLLVASVAGGTYVLVKHNPFKKADASVTNPAQQPQPGQPATNPAATPGAVPTIAGDPNAMPQPTPDSGFSGAGGNPTPTNPSAARPNPSPNPNPSSASPAMPQPTPSSSLPNPNPAPDINPAANPSGPPGAAPSINPAPSTSAVAYTLPFNNVKFRVRLQSRLNTDTSEEGQSIRAAVLTPTPYKGCTMDGVVQKTGHTGFIGMRKVELLFTFYTIHFPDGTSRNIDSRVVAVTNSHGQLNVDEEGEKVDTNNGAKKIFIATAGGAIIGAITGRSKDATVKGANAGAGVGIALTSVAAKGKVMSFAPGSVFALQVTDKQDSN